MNKELLEPGSNMQDTSEKNNYQRYLELDGIINEKDYKSALERTKNFITLGKEEMSKEEKHQQEVWIQQATNTARIAGIELQNTEDAIDQRIILYVILSRDVIPERVKHHHSQMTEQRKFMEALRMLGDVESVNRMIEKYPNISFKYQREAGK